MVTIVTSIDFHLSAIMLMRKYPFHKKMSCAIIISLCSEDKNEIKPCFPSLSLQSAAITGLIGKIVWVWPTWDKVNHENFTMDMKVEIGTTKESFRTFCMCSWNETCQKMCYGVLNEYVDNEYIDMFEIESKFCNIKRVITYEEIREDEAVEKLSQSLSYLGKQGTILDIDEDYYGCSYAIRPLLEAGLTEERVTVIDELIDELFCPKDAAEEFLTDRLLVGFLNEILKLRCTRGIKGATGHDCLNEIFILTLTERLKKKIFQNNSNLLCSDKGGKHMQKMTMKHLIKQFALLNNTQNKALQYVGFCFSSSPFTFNLSTDVSFRTCHGSNTPNASVVIEHNTNMSDITKRTKSLQRILSVVKRANPTVVTLCRSMRDGYTPRQFFSKIENDVIDSVRNVFGKTNIVYDTDLLGGRKGWPNRQ